MLFSSQYSITIHKPTSFCMKLRNMRAPFSEARTLRKLPCEYSLVSWFRKESFLCTGCPRSSFLQSCKDHSHPLPLHTPRRYKYSLAPARTTGLIAQPHLFPISHGKPLLALWATKQHANKREGGHCLVKAFPCLSNEPLTKATDFVPPSEEDWPGNIHC